MKLEIEGLFISRQEEPKRIAGAMSEALRRDETESSLPFCSV